MLKLVVVNSLPKIIVLPNTRVRIWPLAGLIVRLQVGLGEVGTASAEVERLVRGGECIRVVGGRLRI